jgi:tetratricopeptide (TPR) repeat protein
MKQHLFPVFAVVTAVLIAGGVYFYTANGTSTNTDNRVETAKQITLTVIDSGIDFSNSIYPPEDEPLIEQRIEDAKQKILTESPFQEQHIFGTATWFYTTNDFDRALKLYEAADILEAGDLNYRINRAQINIKRGNIDPAITELQVLATDWPIPATFITLAEAYKLLPDTPNYVIDDIYADGLSKQVSRTFDLLEATINWYEASGRPEAAIEYYEDIIKLVPDPTEFQNRLNEIKNQ